MIYPVFLSTHPKRSRNSPITFPPPFFFYLHLRYFLLNVVLRSFIFLIVPSCGKIFPSPLHLTHPRRAFALFLHFYLFIVQHFPDHTNDPPPPPPVKIRNSVFPLVTWGGCIRRSQSIVMKDQLLKAKRDLQVALRDALEAREEINRRKQHGEDLLARLRVLQVRMAEEYGQDNNLGKKQLGRRSSIVTVGRRRFTV